MKQTALDLVEKLPEGTALLPCRRRVSCLTLGAEGGARASKSTEGDTQLAGTPFLDRDSAAVMLGAADLATDHRTQHLGRRDSFLRRQKQVAVFFSRRIYTRLYVKGVTVTTHSWPLRNELLAGLLGNNAGS